MRLFCAICLATLLLTSFQPTQQFRKVVVTGRAQGTTYSITYYAADSIVTKYQVDSLLNKIDSSLSIYKPYSLISQFNNSTTTRTNIDEHLKTVVEKSLEVCRETNGIFDITIQPVVQAWGFGTEPIDSLPSAATLRMLKKCVGSKWLILENNWLGKKKSCVKIDVNGIAQGYAVDVLARLLDANSIKNYLVELGGEIRVKGRKQPGNEKMRIGIEAPADHEFAPGTVQHIIEVDSGAITTSGSYRKYYESQGKKITHIIDPRTAYPAQNELISVTVYAKNAIIADAFDNALMVMGLKKALNFVEKRNDIAAHFIYRKQDGTVADTASTDFYKLFRH
jgi:FAD:protein FMN transferase